jgi:hypothetical protein
VTETQKPTLLRELGLREATALNMIELDDSTYMECPAKSMFFVLI